MKRKYIITVGSALTAAILCYFLFFSGKSIKDDQPIGQIQRIIKVMRGNLDLTVSSNGVVQPINKVEVRSKAGGKIVQLNFIEGQFVNQGDLLILVDQTITKNNLDQAKADLETAKATLAQAQNNNKRTLELYNKGLVSQMEVDQSNTDLVRTQAQLVKANASLSNAEDQMNDTRIVAPVSGIVLSKTVELGQIISSATSNVGGGTLLATVADMNEVYVYAKVDEVDIGKVKVGQKSIAIADAYPEDRFEGQVERIAPQGLTQQNVTTFDVIVLMKNEGWKLKAGMSTSVDIQVFNRINVLLLPNEALKDMKSEQGKALMTQANLTIPKEALTQQTKQVKGTGGETDRENRHERFQNMSQEERDKFRKQMQERLEKMTPEEREKFRSERRQQRMQGRSQDNEQGGRGMTQFGGDAESQTSRPRRRAQVSNENDIRWKIVVVKEGGNYKPRIVKTGASNFENTEILEGLKEEDEIQVTSISRAKIASQQMTDRIKSANPLSGGGGGAVRMGGGGRDH